MQYKYAWDENGKKFSKWEWIAVASPHLQENNAPEEASILRTLEMWEKHLRTSTIVLSDAESPNFWEAKSLSISQSILDQNKGKEPCDFLIGCTYCHHIHVTEADGFPSSHFQNNLIHKASKECIVTFNKRIII